MSGAFGEWAQTYEREPNALLALADRALAAHLGELHGLRVLDAGCGTGRWLRRVNGVGLDFERAMLRQATPARLVEGALGALPFRTDSFDLALAVFSLSYADDPRAALVELSRVAGRVVIADLHPDAAEAGWKRTYRGREGTAEIASRPLELEAALLDPPPGWRVAALDSARFGEAERHLFTDQRWELVRNVWAVRVAVWRRAE